MKIQPIDWEKIFAKDATDKGLIFKIYEQLIQLKKKNSIKKWTEESFLQRTHTDGQQAHEKMLNIANY